MPFLLLLLFLLNVGTLLLLLTVGRHLHHFLQVAGRNHNQILGLFRFRLKIVGIENFRLVEYVRGQVEIVVAQGVNTIDVSHGPTGKGVSLGNSLLDSPEQIVDELVGSPSHAFVH